MNRILSWGGPLDRLGDWALPLLARLVFAGVLLGYFWLSALTKFEFPETMNASGQSTTQADRRPRSWAA